MTNRTRQGETIRNLPPHLAGITEMSDLRAILNGGIGVVDITNEKDQEDLKELWFERTIRNWRIK